MRIGTRSLLYGAHCFFIHPWFVALAWTRLFGFPWDPRLWVAFIVHDWGYWGLPNMDGKEGEQHPIVGAMIMSLFGSKWYWLCLNHSRYFAKWMHEEPSRLCYADKLSFCLTPWWIYLPMAWTTGELKGYMEDGKRVVAEEPDICGIEELMSSSDALSWWYGVDARLQRFVEEHKNGEPDNWTVRRDHRE